MRPWKAGRLAIISLVVSACSAPAASPATSPGRTTSVQATASAPSPAASATVQATASAPSPAATRPPLAWTRLAQGPPAREDHTWTVDPGGEVAYLFGGRSGSVMFGDTWAYDLAADRWTELAPTSPPPARFGHEAVWVDDVGLVIFGGQAGATFYGDLWAFDPETTTWSRLPAAGDLPTARYGSCAAIGPDGRLWISHGFTEDQVRFADTRAYDFASGTWADETPDGARPVERCLHGCWWTDDGALALFAGQTTGVTALDDHWLLVEGAWSRSDAIGVPARNLYARARIAGGTLIHGGQAVDGSYLADLWMLADAGGATALRPGGPAPPGRAGAEMVIDPVRGRALLFGGRTADGALDDGWALGGL